MKQDMSKIKLHTFSGWIDPPTDLQPAVSGEVTCDVAVIGGGVGGMATATRLADRGRDVVLLEAEFCGYGSSSRNGGHISGAPGGDLRMLKLFYPKLMKGMVVLADRAAEYLQAQIKDHRIDCDYVPNGLSFGAISPIQMLRVKACAKILRDAGGRGQVGTAEEIGIPRAFVGGMREGVGGMLNPGKLCRGLRGVLLAGSARVYEQSKVTDMRRESGKIVITTPGGAVIANKVVLSTNAYSGEWDITPKGLSIPAWIIEVETEPIDPARIEALGWTSRSGVLSQHQIMEHFRVTERNTMVFGVRRLERGTSYPLPENKAPDPGLVQELADAFHTRFPSLADVRVAQAWGGWIAITSSWVSVAGQTGDDVYYSCCCNGHGLAQAPYIGSLIADYIVDGKRHEDLQTIWKDEPKFPPFMMMGRAGLRTVWVLDRICDAFNGNKRRAQRGAASAERGEFIPITEGQVQLL
ncbi:NAD(P)/FAD-dependent oxidoreductase [Flexivirga oryzae]|uniref:Glycine/D-amino acid oxidase-like deaminating enzyme n=1 Tax=Flexivirga oryzae TaxID=1794944 RepID=A0A839N6Y4_9MICO|nr:FAD-binding oxidoreductase [Flexivirga oryzae]MBB2890975.1 glycine/D-amino acid oxidase-like deaminating enzyme [Flexivirga oryzae]